MARRTAKRRDPRLRRMYLRRRAVALAVIAGIIAAAVVALDGRGSGNRRVRAARTGPSAASLGQRTRRARPRSRIPPLSLLQLAGQRVIYAYSGLTPPPALMSAVRAGEAAGVILFAPNVASPGQVRAVVDELQRANAAGPVHSPLLILSDQEGGQVRRVPGAPELSERQIGDRTDGVAVASQAGAGAAETLAAAGINVNLSPVLDVYREPGNFIDEFERAYSSDPQATAALGRAFIASQQRLRVAATAKHFPGLGAARRGQDTDSRPVTLDLPVDQLRSVDEAPYRSAIAAGVKLVMTSWAVYPALDPALPAGLSSRVVQGELRGRLGYRGVTITDTLSAAALTQFGTLAQRGVRAAAAGADLIICSAIDGNDSPSGGLEVLHAIATAISGGQLSRAAAEESVARVLALRSSL